MWTKITYWIDLTAAYLHSFFFKRYKDTDLVPIYFHGVLTYLPLTPLKGKEKFKVSDEFQSQFPISTALETVKVGFESPEEILTIKKMSGEVETRIF